MSGPISLRISPMYRGGSKSCPRGKALHLDIGPLRIAVGVSLGHPTLVWRYRLRFCQKTAFQIRIGPFSAGMMIRKKCPFCGPIQNPKSEIQNPKSQ